MVCFGNGHIDWNAISAVGTLVASVVALFASWLAFKAPEWSKGADRREATHEIIVAAEEAIRLYHKAYQWAVVQKTWPTDEIISLRIRANHLYEALDRLIDKPFLTDGAIVVGTGSKAILLVLSSLKTSQEKRSSRIFQAEYQAERLVARLANSSDAEPETFESMKTTVAIVLDRIARVKKHAGMTN